MSFMTVPLTKDFVVDREKDGVVAKSGDDAGFV